MHTPSWFVRQPGSTRRLRLYCFAYAGGSATSFLTWQAALDPAVELCAIQLPGRGARFSEKPFDQLRPLVTTLADQIQRDSTLPCAFFGHSLGSLLAFEVARQLQLEGQRMPSHLFLSGCQAPRYRTPSKNLSRLDDASLIEALKQYNGTPREVLEHRELMALLLPTIRADFALVDDFKYQSGPLLDVPLTILAGKSDQYDLPLQVEGWREETGRECRVEWFEGDHFFIHSQQAAVLECVNADLAPLLSHQSYPRYA